MRINYDRYPLLQFLNRNMLPKLRGKITLRGEDISIWNTDTDAALTAQLSINEMYEGYIADRCGNNIYILMPKFKEALEKSCNVFKNISRGVQLEKLFEDCCIVFGDMACMCYKLSNETFLGQKLNSVERPNNYVLTIYYQGKGDDNKDRHIVYLGTIVFSKENDNAYRIEISLLSTFLGLYAVNYIDNSQLVDTILAVLMFKHYAKVELDVIPGHERKVTPVANEKVINETPNGVHIMDSSWYTTIYRTEGFDVRGHIRHYKAYDKITYVNQHKRKGYVRRAKILNDPTAEPDTVEHDMKLYALENR